MASPSVRDVAQHIVAFVRANGHVEAARAVQSEFVGLPDPIGGYDEDEGATDANTDATDDADDAPVKLVQYACDATIPGPSAGFEDLEYLPDGRLVSAHENGMVSVWDLDGRCLSELSGHVGRVACVAVLSDGCRVASGAVDCTVKIWDTNNGRILRTLSGHVGWVECIAVVPDDRVDRVVSGARRGAIKIWNANICTGWHKNNCSFIIKIKLL